MIVFSFQKVKFTGYEKRKRIVFVDLLIFVF
jgi:hypothetical protein